MENCAKSRFCRNESCDRLDLHLKHKVARKPPEPVSHGRNPEWLRPAPKALDHSIAKAVSKTYPRHFNAILQVVESDYGSCNYQTVRRHLRRLIERGHVLRIDLGQQLYAYLRPGSPLVNDIALMREQLADVLYTTVTT